MVKKYWLASLGLCLVSTVFGFDKFSPSTPKVVVLIAFDESDTSDRILAPNDGNFWYKLKQACAEHGYLLTTRRYQYKNPYALVAFNAPAQGVKNHAAHKKILYTWEPATVLARNFDTRVHSEYDMVMTWHDGLVNGKKYRKFNYALQFGMPETLPAFADKKLCAFFGANKSSSNPQELYSKRFESLMFFDKHAPQDFDFYGPGWPSQRFTTYRGYVTDKLGQLGRYRFGLAYENMKAPGYITEKIFDTFSAGSVPVYYGAPNIANYIPSNCFIDRRLFSNDAALYQFLKDMTEEQYEQYITNIRAFLTSEQAQKFSCEDYIKTFIEALDSSGS